MPVVQNLIRVTFDVEPRKTVNPDEAVALGNEMISSLPVLVLYAR